MRIATWNIGGGHKIKSLKTFDYEAEINIDYFVDELKKLQLDIVCLQESQCNDGYSVAKVIADKLGMPHVYETPMHPSHVDTGYELSLAILSTKPFDNKQSYVQPYPSFDLFLPNGKPAGRYDNYIQVVELEGLQVAHTMNQPLEFLGHPYEDEYGKTYAKELCDMFNETLQRPLVFVGDFNTPNPAVTFKATCDHLSLKDALPAEATKPHGEGHLDCIFYSSELNANAAAVLQTETDHYLCWAEVNSL